MNYFLSNWKPIIIPYVILLVALLVFSIYKLRNNRALAEKLCFYVLGFIFIYKTLYFLLNAITLKNSWISMIPCEISQLSYFLCPIAFFTRNKWLRDGGVFVGILAGAVELVSVAIAPDRFARVGLSVFDFFETTLAHYSVLWGGMIQACCIEKLKVKNLWRNYLEFLIVILWGVLASYTWMFGTDYGHPNEPANIGFTQRCDMLPDAILERFPWLLENHLFIIPYLIIFFIFTAGVYLVSNLCMKNVKPQDASMYGLGIKGFRDFMKTNAVKENFEKN